MTFSLVKEMLSRKAGSGYHPATEGPLARCGLESIRHMRNGGTVDLSLAEATFIIVMASSGALFVSPVLSSLIHAHGRVRDDQFDIHRFYFGEKWFLQAIIDAEEKLSGPLRIFSKLVEVNPTSEEEWGAWLGDSSLLRGQTVDWQGVAQYRRLWLPDAEYVDPKQYREVAGERAISSEAMMFVRALSVTRSEYLYLATCRRDDGTRWIEAYIGIDLDPMEVVAI